MSLKSIVEYHPMEEETLLDHKKAGNVRIT